MKLVVFGLTISSSWGNGHAAAIGGAARRRALAEHTAERRAQEMISLLETGGAPVANGRGR